MATTFGFTVLFVLLHGDPVAFSLRDPPGPLVVALAELDSRLESDVRGAIELLARDPVSIPLLRDRISSLLPHQTRAYDRALRAAEQSAVRRIATRAITWSSDLRPDLLVEFASFDAGESDRAGQAQPLFDFQQSMNPLIRDNKSICRYNSNNFFAASGRWDEVVKKGFVHPAFGKNIVIKKNVDTRRFIAANTVEIHTGMRSGWMVATTHGVGERRKISDWSFSILMCNAPLKNMPFGEMIGDLLIVDGDLECSYDRASFRDSIVICNGAITLTGQSLSFGTYYWARDHITLPPGMIAKESVFASNDRVVGRIPGTSTFHEKLKGEILGIRFFQLSDIGIAAKAHAKGAEITAISPFSPLRLFGLRVGDVVTKVDDRAVDSVDALRRATRTAYVREAGVYYLLREGKAIDRIVVFGDYQLPK